MIKIKMILSQVITDQSKINKQPCVLPYYLEGAPDMNFLVHLCD